jgi:hypothetical protein
MLAVVRRLAVRNGSHQSREVLTSAGTVEVTVPRVNDKRTDQDTGQRKRFSSAILPPWARKPEGHRGAAAVVPARPVVPGLHARSRPVPRLASRADRPGDQRMVNAPHLVALVRAGATSINGKPAERAGTARSRLKSSSQSLGNFC